MKSNAIVLTLDMLDGIYGKTAHGLIRGSSKFNIVAVVDHVAAGKDAGEVLDGLKRDIPVVASIDDAIASSDSKVEFLIVGGAFIGGQIPETWVKILLEGIDKGLSIICGLHTYLNDQKEFRERAERRGVKLIDIRKPKPTSELVYWTGEILNLQTPRIAVLGIDCGIGKRTTARFLTETCAAEGIKAEMIYTGQTGWLQGYKYGFILDSTLNDFVCGELEKAILTCDRETSPDIIFLEGQSSLRNPSGPCGGEYLLSADVDGIVLQIDPSRIYFGGFEKTGRKLPDVLDEIRLITMYGVKTLAITLNGDNSTPQELIDYQKNLSRKVDIPVIRPIEEGMGALMGTIKNMIQNKRNKR
ncbi:MAG: DUF1611 domain-containing protein [Proteobacteria bacterium]|nr:DUF1611 domain-containing protein [Pseudomonadota bacterium]